MEGRLVLTEAHDGVRLAVQEGVEVLSWSGGGVDLDGSGTAFVMVLEPSCVTVPYGAYPLPARSYAVLPDRAHVEGGCGVVITDRSHRGLFQIGGPAESRGRLRYIDGCSDTVLVAPVVRGNPCLNLLHVPADTVQSDHEHPSARIGLVLAGEGWCVLDHERRALMLPGSVFVLPAHATHRFETGPGDELLVMAWHPDSDSGPTDDDHPMLNRTLRPGLSAQVR
jgi:quercetin dioxygenase-like cupin family protein